MAKVKWISPVKEAGENASDTTATKESLTVKFRKSPEKKAVTMFLSKDLVEKIKEKELTHLRFGLEEEGKNVVLQFDKKENGLKLTDDKSELRKSISVTEYVEALAKEGAHVKFNEKLTVEFQSRNKVTVPYSENEEVLVKEPSNPDPEGADKSKNQE